MKHDIHFLGIDLQNDFIGGMPEKYMPTDPLAGEFIRPQLPVTGAHGDMLRIAELIRKGLNGLTRITATLDSHHKVGIERPAMWAMGDGSPMLAGTRVPAAAVRSGAIRVRNPQHIDRVLAYLDALEAGGRYVHTIWTPHAEIGTWGHSLHADVRAAFNVWEERFLACVGKVTKGSNPWTEHYSAVMAEVPAADDPSTQLNRRLIDDLAQADMVLIAGEAGSHCVKATTEHIADNFGAESLKKLVLLTDCISPVPGFEAEYQSFLANMTARGLRTATSTDIVGELVANGRR